MNTWIQTYTGKAFDLLHPTPAMVCIEDIAHHLALINRFTGATAEPYSVAQHSVLCSYVVPPEHALAALLHDAAEAYCTDVSRPLKEAMRTVAGGATPYDQIIHVVECAIGVRFGVELAELDPQVKHADVCMLATERVHLHHSVAKEWDVAATPYELPEENIAPWPWREAESRFLYRFDHLSPGRR